MPEDPALLNPNRTLHRTPTHELDKLSFRWLASETLASNNLKPDFLHRELPHPPKTAKHLELAPIGWQLFALDGSPSD
ncbi:MAG: hypothetical protein ACR2KW_00430 [Rubrobacter sp.]